MDVEGFGSADVPGLAALPEAAGVGLAPGTGVVPSLAVAVTPGETAPVPVGLRRLGGQR